MKKLSTILLLTVTLLLSCSKEEDPPSPISTPTTSYYTLTVWSNFSGAPITVYINGVYRGQITSYYTSSPSCNASGCVSMDFTTSGSFTYSANDGTHTWSGSSTVSSSCNTLNLHL
jgi:hypothetical protein